MTSGATVEAIASAVSTGVRPVYGRRLFRVAPQAEGIVGIRGRDANEVSAILHLGLVGFSGRLVARKRGFGLQRELRSRWRAQLCRGRGVSPRQGRAQLDPF